uniref:Uncharacterized protein n=1 Tax=Chromera velia CCMP2878 TaxID=1169474 RepID=A0A0G4HBX4_9ALVE|eukprot:Cvel_26058.t1-p1 / transcript=Cvel_26058.t1 / gene=Cvel_26058 / organism=Chromera_velia_CCMP2878 / gene_product=hypothetical protein / transcript_product=hypothetical protein / location=Cvel_scaffold3039:515-11089(+) / protein_length=604 / sequence_SO=supercontig / SO=protein_coding / is_pseudo=false
MFASAGSSSSSGSPNVSAENENNRENPNEHDDSERLERTGGQTVREAAAVIPPPTEKPSARDPNGIASATQRENTVGIPDLSRHSHEEAPYSQAESAASPPDATVGGAAATAQADASVSAERQGGRCAEGQGQDQTEPLDFQPYRRASRDLRRILYHLKETVEMDCMQPKSQISGTRPPGLSVESPDFEQAKVHISVDALNVVDCFFNGLTHEDPPRLFANSEKEMGRFLEECKRRSISLTFHFDDAKTSDETRKKWISRREAEMRKGGRRIPYNIDAIYQELLVDLGAQIVIASQEDCDDSIAAEAVRKGGYVLSADNDMFRYDGGVLRGRVLSTFSFWKGDLYFRPHAERQDVKRDKSTEKVIVEEPVSPDANISKVKPVREGNRLVYVRGCSSGRDREYGNLHGLPRVREFRRALFSFHDSSVGSVEETFPMWNAETETVQWVCEEVVVGPQGGEWSAVMEVLKDPVETYKAILSDISEEAQKDGEYRASVRMLAAELHCASLGKGARALSAYKVILAHDGRKMPEGRKPASSTALIVTCSDCGKDFHLKTSFMCRLEAKGWSIPKRCQTCRDARKGKWEFSADAARKTAKGNQQGRTDSR